MSNPGGVTLCGGFRRAGNDLPSCPPYTFLIEGLNQLSKPTAAHYTVGIGESDNLPSAGLDPFVPSTRSPLSLFLEIPDWETVNNLGRPIRRAVIHHQDFPAFDRVVHLEERDQTILNRLLPVQNRDDNGNEGACPLFHLYL